VTEPAIQSTTTIRVRDLQLLADIGINPDEIGRRQPLVVTVELLLNVTEGVEAIAQTVDYRRVSQAAEELAQVHFPLIETFGLRLGEQCLRFAGVTEARVSLDKPFALTRGTAGVEVVVKRSSGIGIVLPGQNK